MKVSKTIGSTTFTAEGETTLEIFKELAALQEAFSDDHCEKCKGTNLKYVCRVSTKDGETYPFQDLVCQSCSSKLHFGLSQKGDNLYPKRFKTNNKGKALKDDNDRAIKVGENGWLKWNFEKKVEE